MRNIEWLVNQLSVVSIDDAKAAYAIRWQVERDRLAMIDARLKDEGYEVVGASSGHVTGDGRAVLRVGRIAYAMRHDAHADRQRSDFEAEKMRRGGAVQNGQLVGSETKSVVGTESLSQVICPKCGDSLQHTAVCPSCAAGKLGYRHRYTCVCGAVDLISKEAL